MAMMKGGHRWTFVVPLLAALFLVLKFLHLLDSFLGIALVIAAALLLGTVFAAVHQIGRAHV